ncbi:hypothetical protein FRB94_008154 [Tulasnella sp. JGI-2019a]|nr:hypothetical protein FRB94_008154 [Tulasnella sp. JGI-2019a]
MATSSPTTSSLYPLQGPLKDIMRHPSRFIDGVTIRGSSHLISDIATKQFSVDSRTFDTGLTHRCQCRVANAAQNRKTTILKKICKETDVPIVRDRDGNQVTELEDLNPTARRGLHNIDNEITYPSNPLFAFHDSRGVEAASMTEMKQLEDFIARRSSMELRERLHAAWICLPLDEERPLGDAEMYMLKLNPDDIPVILVFTKYDGLETRTFNNLQRQGQLGKREAFRAMPITAERLFKEQWVDKIYTTEPPKPPFVRLKDLHKPEGKCDALLECTEDVLKDNKPAQKIFVLAQTYSPERRLKYAVDDIIKYLLETKDYRGPKALRDAAGRFLSWMPHVHRSQEVSSEARTLEISTFIDPLAPLSLPL